MKHAIWNRSGVLAAAGSLALLLTAAPASAQAPDAADRCTPDVMRLCSEFVPDADSIVVCLKAKRLQLTSSCLNALSPAPLEPLASQVSATKKLQKARRTVSTVDAARSTRIQHQAAAAR